MSLLVLAALLAAQPGTAPMTAQAPATAPAARLDPAAVVGEVRRIIAEHYVLPERRPALDAVLAAGLASGRYSVAEPAVLAERIDADLARAGRDHHLNFTHDPARVAAMTARGEGGRPDPSAFEAAVRARNHGIDQLRVLPGNVRYLDIAGFDWVGPDSEAAIEAAMAFLKGGDAVVIDVRRNGGGNGRAVHQVVSHFLAAGTPLIAFHRGGEVDPAMTSLPGLSTMVGKRLYLLTSGTTGSAAEEFAGHVAGYRLGEVVGARTSGGAYMNAVFPVDGRFELSVSVARPVLAATGTDWEGTGIAPTVPAPVEDALETAHLLAVRRLAAAADPARRAALDGLADGLQAAMRPAAPAAPLAAYAGDYGERRIALEDGALRYLFQRRPARRLVPLGGHRFTFADDPAQRIGFTLARGRATAFDMGLAGGPVQGRYERKR